uniref:Putative secreted peptide n=1 Tax=Anopheles braziliensis TaxID=58242 RepID=A0A2M3ZPX9_9DIPT
MHTIPLENATVAPKGLLLQRKIVFFLLVVVVVADLGFSLSSRSHGENQARRIENTKREEGGKRGNCTKRDA